MRKWVNEIGGLELSEHQLLQRRDTESSIFSTPCTSIAGNKGGSHLMSNFIWEACQKSRGTTDSCWILGVQMALIVGEAVTQIGHRILHDWTSHHNGHHNGSWIFCSSYLLKDAVPSSLQDTLSLLSFIFNHLQTSSIHTRCIKQNLQHNKCSLFHAI